MAELSPQNRDVISLACDNDVAGGELVVPSTNANKCKLPATIFDLPIGVVGRLDAATLTTASGRAAPIVLDGVARVKVTTGSTFAVGDIVCLGDTTGGVTKFSPGAQNGTIVGVAQSAVTSSTAGQFALVLLTLAGQNRNTPIIEVMTSGGAITANTIVVAGAAGVCSAPGGADPTSGVLGVALNTVAGASLPVLVVTHGPCNLTTSAAVTAGNNVAVSGTNGQGKNAAPSAGTNSMCVGTSRTTVGGAGTIVVHVNPFVFQG